jgi:hypothetical protein
MLGTFRFDFNQKSPCDAAAVKVNLEQKLNWYVPIDVLPYFFHVMRWVSKHFCSEYSWFE